MPQLEIGKPITKEVMDLINACLNLLSKWEDTGIPEGDEEAAVVEALLVLNAEAMSEM